MKQFIRMAFFAVLFLFLAATNSRSQTPALDGINFKGQANTFRTRPAANGAPSSSCSGNEQYTQLDDTTGNPLWVCKNGTMVHLPAGGANLPHVQQQLGGDGLGNGVGLPEEVISVSGGVGTVACQEDHSAGIYDPRCPRYAGGVFGPTPNAAAQAMSNQMACDLALGVVHYAVAKWPQGVFNIDQLVIAPGSDWEGSPASVGGTLWHSIYNNHQVALAPSSMTLTCSDGNSHTLTQGRTLLRHISTQGCGVGGCTNAPGDTGTYADGGPFNTGIQMSDTAGVLDYDEAVNFGGFGIRIDGQDTKAYHLTASNNLEWFYFSNGAYKGVNETLTSPETSVTTTGTTSSVTLNWAAVTGATGYVVYRGTSAGNENVFYMTTTNSFTDTGAANNGASPAGFAYANAPSSAPGTITPTASTTGGTLAPGTYYYKVTATTVDGWHGSVEFAGADDMADWIEVFGFFDGATQFTYHHLADIIGGGGDSHFDHLWPQLGHVGIAVPFGSGGGNHFENVRIDFARLEGFWSSDTNTYVDGGNIDGSCTSANAPTLGGGFCQQLVISNGGGITSIFFSDNNGFGPTYKTADYALNGTTYRHGINGTIQYTGTAGKSGGANYEPYAETSTNVTGPQPDVSGLWLINPTDTTPTRYTGFLHGQPFQDIWVQTGNANVTIGYNPPYIITCSGQDINLGTATGVLHFQANGAFGLFGLPPQAVEVCNSINQTYWRVGWLPTTSIALTNQFASDIFGSSIVRQVPLVAPVVTPISYGAPGTFSYCYMVDAIVDGEIWRTPTTCDGHTPVHSQTPNGQWIQITQSLPVGWESASLYLYSTTDPSFTPGKLVTWTPPLASAPNLNITEQLNYNTDTSPTSGTVPTDPTGGINGTGGYNSQRNVPMSSAEPCQLGDFVFGAAPAAVGSGKGYYSCDALNHWTYYPLTPTGTSW